MDNVVVDKEGTRPATLAENLALSSRARYFELLDRVTSLEERVEDLENLK